MSKILFTFWLLATAAWSQTWKETSNWVVYEPTPNAVGLGVICCFSPHGDARAAAQQWTKLAARANLLVVASKVFRNGPNDFGAISRTFRSEIQTPYQCDSSRSVCTGLSGGGQASYTMVNRNPDLFMGVIVNTCRINPDEFKGRWAPNKAAVMLASPGDFRYAEMQTDKDFLESKGWYTHWVEFKGGHTYAPASTLDTALRKLMLLR